MSSKAALIILDGWGHSTNPTVSAIDQASTPYVDHLYDTYADAELTTFGGAVGLPDGQMGNSEVGHLNIGAGRVVYQDLALINKHIADNTLKNQPALQSALAYARDNNCKVHLLGLVSDGGVHSHVNHVKALCDIFADVERPVFIHAFMDGRDTAPHGGADYLRDIAQHIEGTNARIATAVGRYYAMDRDNRWERVKLAYDLLVNNKGEAADDIIKTIEARYAAGETDEFIKPIVKASLAGKCNIEAGDLVLFYNFRTDRPRQLTSVLTQQDRPEDGMTTLDLHFLTMTVYNEAFEGLHPIFTKDKIKNTLGQVISQADKTQVRAAETEKYPHVTFFFNGGEEVAFEGEDRILIPSPKVATYDLMPQMSAVTLTKRLIAKVNSDTPDFICLNYANTDMVGHTGDLRAAVLAAQTVDRCLSKLVPVLIEKGYEVVIIADHGNADIMRKPDGSPHTAHTTNMVPVILVSDRYKSIKSGKLGDIAPTILHLMGIEQPSDMTGDVLV
jgi:2,3-bisphosphoglycerate-independent phosphoglycerate mutase